VLGQLLLTSVAVYAASFSKSTLRAVLAVFVIIAASFGLFCLMASSANKVLRQFAAGHAFSADNLVVPVLCAGFGLMLCLTQWLAWCNFRRFGLSVGRLIVQFLIVLYAVGVVSLAILTALFGVQFGAK